MKKIIYVLFVVFVAFSCKDFNVDEDWLDDSGKPTNVAAYEYTVVDADFTTIATGLKANKTKADTLRANQLLTLKKFTPEFTPAELIPYLLNSKYFTADLKSSAKITYKYDAARDAVVSGLSGAGYILNASDYKLAWGSDLYASSLNPQKTPDAKLPLILAANYTASEEGDYVTLEYSYSTENSVTSVVEGTPVYFSEDFESYATDAFSIPGWINKDVSGVKQWQVKYFATENNKYMQITSNGNPLEKNTSWLITPQVDLEAAITPYLTFFVTAGYYNADCLSIKISTNFDGTEAGIGTATWTDITNKFTLPKAPASGYGTLATAGMGDLGAYKGKKVYIAFKYDGDDTTTPVKTTTFQVDKVKVCEATVGIDVPNKVPQYASYTYSGGAWKKVGSNIITLQPADYTELEITTNTMTAAQAKDLLPQYLVRNAIGVEGTEKVLVYRTKAGEFYAEKYTFTSGSWVLNTTLSDQTSQFVRGWDSTAKKSKWVFDPTHILTLTKEDYMMVVTYVQNNLVSAQNPDLINATYKDSEYYYGFSANYRNITYRDRDRKLDKTYPADATDADKTAFMNQRTKDGLILFLTLKYPDAQPMVSGVEQFAEIRNLTIFSEPGIVLPNNNGYWSYTFQCVGDKDWKFVSRESNDGRSEVAQ
ncbi:choice-of-anchor J domain-containing protein [Dysgonomonas reticulitermitis]